MGEVSDACASVIDSGISGPCVCMGVSMSASGARYGFGDEDDVEILGI